MKQLKIELITIGVNLIVISLLALNPTNKIFYFILLVINNSILLTVIVKKYQQNELEYKELNQSIEKLLVGNHELEFLPKKNQHQILYANINRLTRRLEKMSFKKEEDQQTIQLLVNNITSPIIYIDIDGKIRYMNLPFVQKFKEKLKNNDLYENIANRILFKFIDDAFIKEVHRTKTLQINENYYHSIAIPVKNQFFVGILFIFHDVTDLKKYENLQRHFLANASHELKTPLSAIKGSAEILLDRKHSQEALNEFLTIIKIENERMEKIVNEILLISRLESDNIKLKFTNISLNLLLNDVIYEITFHANKKKQMIHLNLEEGLEVIGDRERLRQVFHNLIINAIHYTDINKSIYVKGYRKNSNIIIEVQDEGIGISEDNIPHLFERFYRVDRARSRETGGTGLGLSIVKTILDHHQVKIEVKSQVEMGTTFKLYFNTEEKPAS